MGHTASCVFMKSEIIQRKKVDQGNKQGGMNTMSISRFHEMYVSLLGVQFSSSFWRRELSRSMGCTEILRTPLYLCHVS